MPRRHSCRRSSSTRWLGLAFLLFGLYGSTSLWAQAAGENALVFPRLDCLSDVDHRFIQGEAFGQPSGFVTPRRVRVPVDDWNLLAVTARLGYISQNETPHEIRAGGPANFMTPGDSQRNQPRLFLPGLHLPVFTETFFPPDDQWELIWFLGRTTLRMRNNPQTYCAPSATLQHPTMVQPGHSITLDISGRLLRPDHQVWLSGLQGEVQAEVLIYHPRGLRAKVELPADASGVWSIALRLADESMPPMVAGVVSLGQQPQQVNAALRTQDGTVLAGTETHGLFRRASGGTWQQLDQPPAGASILSLAGPASADRLFAGTAGHGLFASSDDGLTWQALSALPAARVNTLQLLDGEGLAVLAGTESGLYLSGDGGQSWEIVPLETP